jgi:DNA-binding MarR family transcriptional regulator
MSEDQYNTYSFLLDKTSRRIKQYAQKRFKELEFGVTVDQWIILKKLYEQDGIPQCDLAESTFKDTPTLTRIIDLLCEKGLVKRVMDEGDRRRFKVYLSEGGREKVKEMLPQVSLIRKKGWEGLQVEDFESFKRILNQIYENLEVI